MWVTGEVGTGKYTELSSVGEVHVVDKMSRHETHLLNKFLKWNVYPIDHLSSSYLLIF